MKARTRSLALGAAALAFVAAFVWLVATRGPLAPVGVETAHVERADLRPLVYGVGTVEPQHAYSVGPVQAGRLLRVLVDQGDQIKRGQVLAEIDSVDLDQRTDALASTVARARAAALAADAQVAEAASRAELAQAALQRYEALHAQHFVAREMVDGRRHEAAAAEAAHAAARASATAARRDIARAEADLRGTVRQRATLKLVSPIDGVVLAREAEPGMTVVAGQAVLRLADPARVWVRARVDQTRAAGVTAGQVADIVLRSTRGVPRPGKVARVELQSDAVTEERIVNVAFDPVPEQLYLGELAEVNIRLPALENVLSVPRAALVHHQGRAGVWQIDRGRTRFAPVQTGVQTAERVEVVAGLAVGDGVIVYSEKQLDAGVRVRARRLAQ
jgi:HlyD family secretion protein